MSNPCQRQREVLSFQLRESTQVTSSSLSAVCRRAHGLAPVWRGHRPVRGGSAEAAAADIAASEN